jgi:hypothetical protein
MKTRSGLSKADRIIEKVGVGMVEVVKSKYDEYLEKPNKKNALEYCKWRLRLHRKLNNSRDRLEEVNTARALGLYDENPGPLCFDLEFDDVFLRREFD